MAEIVRRSIRAQALDVLEPKTLERAAVAEHLI
jgi:hypothetical protein